MRCLFIILMLIQVTVTFALEGEDVIFIEEYDLVKTSVKKKMEDWDVNPTKLDTDTFKFKGQTKNLIDWENLDPYSWLDFNTWLEERKLKDKNEDWRQRLRETGHSELMGRVLKCLGSCVNYRGSKRVLTEYKSKINEGDEFTTEKNSYAWVMLVDGSILKLAPKTSVTLSEINFSKSEILVVLRLNQGFINFQTRIMGEFETLDRVESDLSFSPLPLLKANREYYSIEDYKKMTTEEKLSSAIDKNLGHISQYSVLNKLMNKNNKLFESRNTRFYLYSPNISLEGSNSQVDMFYEPNSNTYVQINETLPNFVKSDQRLQHKEISFRGYKNTKSMSPENGVWYQVNQNGDYISRKNEGNHLLDTMRAFNKRIPSIYLAREIWLEEYSADILNLDLSAYELAMNFGYRLWDEQEKNETLKRLKFIKEYVRRVETTNLVSLRKLLGNKEIRDIDKTYFTFAMQKHYDAIRRMKNSENLKIREMTDAEFYMWVLKHGRM